MDEGQKLEGWKAIAEHLGVSLRTAQYWYDLLGLPVVKGPGNRGRVSASAADLDDWKARNLTLTHDESAPEPEVRPPTAAEAGAPTRPHEDSRSAVTVSQAASPVRKFWIYATLLTVLAVVTYASIRKFAFPRSGKPAAIGMSVNTLIVKDAEGKELWHYSFPLRMSEEYNDPVWAKNFWFAADVDGDGETELIFGAVPLMARDDPDSQTNEVLCFSQDDHRIKWRFTPGRSKVTDNTREEYFPPYWINNVKLVPGRSARNTRIVVSSIHNTQAPAQVAVLDGHGKLLGEYWHPGQLIQIGFADLDGDGKPELLLGGVNNGDHAATLVVFDPDRVHGTATGLSDPGFGLRGFEPGTEKAVVLFPLPCLAREGPKIERYHWVEMLHITQDRLFLAVSAGVARGKMDLLYELDYDLKVRSITPGADVRQQHLDWEKAGYLKHPLDDADLKRMAGEVIVRR
jgi:hypothetical protein